MISLYTQRVFCWHTLGRRALQEAGMNVNSSPEQAIKTLVPGLIEMARSEDDLIEAVYLPDRTFVWAVQWHPEMSFRADENSKKIFKAFVEAAAGRRPRNEMPSAHLTGRAALLDKRYYSTCGNLHGSTTHWYRTAPQFRQITYFSRLPRSPFRRKVTMASFCCQPISRSYDPHQAQWLTGICGCFVSLYFIKSPTPPAILGLSL